MIVDSAKHRSIRKGMSAPPGRAERFEGKGVIATLCNRGCKRRDVTWISHQVEHEQRDSADAGMQISLLTLRDEDGSGDIAEEDLSLEWLVTDVIF